MARIRTIKPEAFTHEGLGQLPPLARCIFFGLLTVADREGRFKWRPMQLAVEVCPYDLVRDAKETLRCLDLLVETKFLQRYQVRGEELACFPSWDKHQKLSRHKEANSQLPPPPTPTTNPVATGAQPGKDRGKTGKGPALDHPGKEGKGKGKTPPPEVPPLARNVVVEPELSDGNARKRADPDGTERFHPLDGKSEDELERTMQDLKRRAIKENGQSPAFMPKSRQRPVSEGPGGHN